MKEVREIMPVFSKQVIVITGASEGIGRALALVLAPQHPQLVLAARNEQRLTEVAADCEQCGAITCVIRTDVTDEQACSDLMQKTVARFGKLDALVNNAGMTMWTNFEDVRDMSVFERLMQVNYLGSVYCTKFALPYLRQSKGRLVAISSVAGLTGVPTRTGYCASKHAMIGFFESVRIELKGTGVTVSIIAPDFVQSEIHKRALGMDGRPLESNPLASQKIMTAEACARMIVRAMEKRQRLLVTSWRGSLGRWGKLIAPAMVDRVAQHASHVPESG